MTVLRLASRCATLTHAAALRCMRQGAAFAALSVVHSGSSFRQRPCSQRRAFFFSIPSAHPGLGTFATFATFAQLPTYPWRVPMLCLSSTE
ncbi:uncharacterized protein LY79DRAFT_542206 [Colletotrichum navitas]|uniref:Uncharacterized protein n=1 Tax=Colletotrichum navitas TaxID=681940 RepID=A0AAD8VA58_9PEZI|nr:uncharacterized protein LY79DRAFT_542206 [Colletotrichum navitas]KAK1597110.1 hypothetical protein LY79DRAFT_542206 [Colletotrichum navitas]